MKLYIRAVVDNESTNKSLNGYLNTHDCTFRPRDKKVVLHKELWARTCIYSANTSFSGKILIGVIAGCGFACMVFEACHSMGNNC